MLGEDEERPPWGGADLPWSAGDVGWWWGGSSFVGLGQTGDPHWWTSAQTKNQCLLVAQSKNQCLLVAQPEDPAGFCFSSEVGPKLGAHQPTPKPFPQRCCAALRDAKPCVIFPKTGFFPGKKNTTSPGQAGCSTPTLAPARGAASSSGADACATTTSPSQHFWAVLGEKRAIFTLPRGKV